MEINKMNNNAETLLKTDEAIYYFVWKKMMEQNSKSFDTYYDEDEDEVIGDNCRYFGWSQPEEEARCALGFIMNPIIAENIEVEDKTAEDEDIITCIMKSNPEWKMSSRSIEMVVLLQCIHDRMNVSLWNSAFETYSAYFDKDGNFDINKLKNIVVSDIENNSNALVHNTTHEIHVDDRTFEFNALNQCAILNYVHEQVQKAKASAGISSLAQQVIFNKPAMLDQKVKENA
jgi:hypothetical protein